MANSNNKVQEGANKKWEPIINTKIAEAKARNVKKRGWVVLRKSWLTSSINYRMELSEQAVFSKLIVMADEFGPVPGLISDNDCRAMPLKYIAHQACCPLEVLESTIKKAKADDSIYENGRGIYLTHFDDYQFTEYDRQKPYRQAKQQAQKGKSLRDLSPEGVTKANEENARRLAAHKAAQGQK